MTDHEEDSGFEEIQIRRNLSANAQGVSPVSVGGPQEGLTHMLREDGHFFQLCPLIGTLVVIPCPLPAGRQMSPHRPLYKPGLRDSLKTSSQSSPGKQNQEHMYMVADRT